MEETVRRIIELLLKYDWLQSGMQSRDPEVPDELPYPIPPGIDFQSRNSHRPLFQASTSIISDTMGDFDFREWSGSSMVWRHFLRNTDGSKAKCNHCGTELQTGRGSTKGLNTHMKTKHTEILAPPVTEESAPTPAKKLKQQTIVFAGKLWCMNVCMYNQIYRY